MTQSSAAGLLGLVNHLQNMESTFTNFLMEATLKLSSMTDASIFLLIETAEGRRFLGKEHLCTAYKNAKLCPIGNDVEFEADVTISCLREKTTVLTSGSNHSLLAESRKRSSSSGDDVSISPSKVSKLQESIKHLVNAKLHGIDKAEAVAVNVKQEDSLHNSDMIDYDLEDGDIKEVFEIEDDTKDTDWSKEPRHDTLDQQTLYEESHNFPVAWVSTDFFGNNIKNQSIINFKSEKDFERFSINRKILDSTLYDLGKFAASKYPFLKPDSNHSKKYLTKVYEEWSKHFEIFRKLKDIRIDYSATRQYSLKVYLRAKLSVAFDGAMRKMRAHMQVTTNMSNNEIEWL